MTRSSFMSEDDINAIIEKNEAVDYGMPPIFSLEENKENGNGDNDESRYSYIGSTSDTYEDVG